MEEDDDTTKLSIKKKGVHLNMKHVKTLNPQYKFGEYLTINSFKSIGDNNVGHSIGVGPVSRINS